MEPKCENLACFANMKGKCYALEEVNKSGKCSFFKLPSEVEGKTIRMLYPEERKLPDIGIGEETKGMSKAQFREWFKKEWDETTLFLLVNHREEIAKIPITLEF